MSITKRTYPSGRIAWRARYSDPSRPGCRQIEKSFPTKVEAERWVIAQKAAVHRGEHVDPRDNRRSVEQVAAAWQATWLDLEPKTRISYDSILKHHVLPRWGSLPIGVVHPEAIQKWIGELAIRLSPNTVRRIYSVLRAVMKVAVERRYLVFNPCDPVRLPKPSAVPTSQRVVLSAAEVKALAEAIDPRFRLFIYTAAYTGLRAGELEALRRRDVDLLHGTLKVERALKEISGDLIFGPTKTAKPRQVTLPRFLIEMLGEHLEAMPADLDALVFTAPEGGPISHHNFYYRHFKPAVTGRICRACGELVTAKAEACPECGGEELDYVLTPSKHRLRFHDLRHTCASLLIDAGAHPKAIQEHLGHRDIQTTFNVYGHLLPSAQEALAAALTGYMRAGSARTT